MRGLIDFLRDDEGQGMVEYGMVLGVVSIALLAVLLLFHNNLSVFFNNSATAIRNVAED